MISWFRSLCVFVVRKKKLLLINGWLFWGWLRELVVKTLKKRLRHTRTRFLRFTTRHHHHLVCWSIESTVTAPSFYSRSRLREDQAPSMKQARSLCNLIQTCHCQPYNCPELRSMCSAYKKTARKEVADSILSRHWNLSIIFTKQTKYQTYTVYDILYHIVPLQRKWGLISMIYQVHELRDYSFAWHWKYDKPHSLWILLPGIWF